MKIRFYLSGLALLIAQAVAAEEPAIGRLFGLAQRADGAPIAARQVHVNGVLVRSSRHNTIWLNGQAQTEAGQSPYRIEANTRHLPEIRVNERFPVRVGETLDLETGERRDSSGVYRNPAKGAP